MKKNSEITYIYSKFIYQFMICDDMQYMKRKSIKKKKENITNMSVSIHDDMQYMQC